MKCLFLLCYVVLVLSVEGLKCPRRLSIDISSGVIDKATNAITHNGITYPENKYYREGWIIRGCICKVKTCIKLCCKEGEAKLNDVCQKHNWKLQIDIHNGTDLIEENAGFHVISDSHDCKGFPMEPQNGDLFFVQKDGSMLEIFENSYISFEHYCLTTFTDQTDQAQAYICADKVRVEELVYANSWGMIISIPFLIITLLVYCLLPANKRNVGTRCQMAYVLSLTCAYIFLVTIQLNASISTTCKVIAILCLYAFMSSFCWMNISCIDIYWTFSGKGGFSRGYNKGRSKQFYFYCLYSYGFPLALVCVMYAINTLEDINLWYHPNFGENRCWLKEGYPLLLYLYGPMGILLVINVTLFLLTAYNIHKLDKESSMVRKDDNKKHYESDKRRFNVYFKLLIALGINWTLEFTSWLVDWQLGPNQIPEIWYLSDACNALYGVFIFYLFVCKRSIRIMLQNRYYTCMGQNNTPKIICQLTSDTEKTSISELTATTKN